MKNDEWPEAFRDRNSPWWWWWRENKYRSELLDKPWADKKPSSRDKQLGAFRHELARRFNRNKPGNPYPKADYMTRDLLAPFTTPPPPIAIGEEGKKSRRAKYVTLPVVSFHVEAACGTILKCIGDLIDQECKAQHINLPKGPKRMQNRPPSWKWLELLDIKDIQNEKIVDENNRAKITSARRESERWNKQFRELLKEQVLHDL